DEIGDECDRRMLDVPDLRERRIEIRAAARHERDARAFLSERLRACESDAFAGAGDDDDPIAKSEVHVASLQVESVSAIRTASSSVSFAPSAIALASSPGAVA